VSRGFQGNSSAHRAPASINSSAEASLTAACRQSLSSRNGSRDNGTGSAENAALPVSASPSEISALALGIVMPVQGNRSHASSKLQVTICSFLHPKKSTGIMCASTLSLSGKLHWALGPLVAEPGRSAEHIRSPGRKSRGLSRRAGTDPKRTYLGQPSSIRVSTLPVAKKLPSHRSNCTPGFKDFSKSSGAITTH